MILIRKANVIPEFQAITCKLAEKMLQQSSKVMINNVNKEGLFKHIDGQTAITLVDEIPH